MPVADPLDYLYPLDVTGVAPTNKVVNERKTLNPPQEPLDFHFIIPAAGPFYRDSMKLTHITTNRELIRGIDWMPGHKFHAASFETQGVRGGIYMTILLMDRTLSGEVRMDEYQTLGGEWTLSENKILEILSNRAVDPRFVTYDEISGKPNVFPPIEHPHPGEDLTGMSEVVAANLEIASAIREGHSQLPTLIAQLILAVEDLRPKYDNVVTIAANQVLTIDLKQIIPNHAAYDLLSANVRALVRNTDSASPTYNMYINSEEVLTVGVNSTGIVKLHNYFSTTLEFHIRIDVPRNS